MIEDNIQSSATDSLLVADELMKLKQLVDAGILTEEEFEQQKANF